MTDLDILYGAFHASKKHSAWKPSIHQFEAGIFNNILKLQEDLRNKTYKASETTDFIIKERGKERLINAEIIRDRVVKHALCDNILMPRLQKYLIYDNGASMKGKGISFCRNRLYSHLKRFYRENGSNDGYILLTDFSKYYDNIRHDKFIEIINRYIKDDYLNWLLETILKVSEIDVSYMIDSEYENCMSVKFDSIKYFRNKPEYINKGLLTKEKMMKKHLNIGDQLSQMAGILYPLDIDNYIKIVSSEKYYARYMDDSYIINRDKDRLWYLLEGIYKHADSLGIFINEKKTRIYKLSEYWTFTKVRYSLRNDGYIIQKIDKEKLVKFRRKAKKLAHIIKNEKEFTDWFMSWYNSHKFYMSKQQKENLFDLLKTIKEECYVHNNAK